MSPRGIDELVRQGGDPSKATERHVAVLMVNIVDYVGLAERLPLEKLGAFMNAYYGLCADAVAGTEGIVDKFIGDGVVGIFGAPLALANPPAAACDAALRLGNHTGGLDTVGEKHGVGPVRLSIGIACGMGVAGNLGTATRFHYTVLGEVVNRAARSERFAKENGRSIIVDRACAEGASPRQFEALADDRFMLIAPR